MAISFVGSNTATATLQTSCTVPMPASLAAGDVVYVVAGTNASSNHTFSEGSGTWTALGENYSNDTNDTNGIVYRKVMGSTPDTDVTISDGGGSTRNWACVSYALRGVDTTTPEDATTQSTQGTNTSQVNSLSITTVTNDAWVITCGISCSNRSGLTITEPSGYTNGAQIIHGSVSLEAVAASKSIATAGAEDPANWTFSTTAGTASYTAFTIAARPSSARSVTADAGSYAVSGVAASLEFGREVVAAAGSYALNGVDVTFSTGKSVVAASGAYSLSGVNASLELGREVAAEIGAYTVVGVDASLERGRETVPDAGAYALNGVNASPELGREVTADVGSYLLTGTDAGLILTTLGGKTLPADAGSYLLTGQDAASELGRLVAAAFGSYLLTGSAATLTPSSVVVVTDVHAASICAVGRLMGKR